MSILRSLGRRPFCVGLIGVMVFFVSVSASRAGSTTATSPETEVLWGLPHSEVEFENPIDPGTTTNGREILEWEDADCINPQSGHNCGGYDDWYVVNQGTDIIDGEADEVWMRQVGQIIGATTSVPSRDVTVHLNSDNNDGEAEIWVDGVWRATLDMCSPSAPQNAWVQVHFESATTHTIEVRATGMTGCPDDNVATYGAAAVVPCEVPIPTLSQGGLALFGMLLLTAMARTLWRRQAA